MKTCPVCQRTADDRFRFCSKDGTLLVTLTPFCPTCHRFYPTGSKFCPGDGSLLEPPARPRRASGRFCEICLTAYPATLAQCPAHGTVLVERRPASQPLFARTLEEVALTPDRGVALDEAAGAIDAPESPVPPTLRLGAPPPSILTPRIRAAWLLVALTLLFFAGALAGAVAGLRADRASGLRSPDAGRTQFAVPVPARSR